MRFLLDTNQWSYLQRQHPVVLARIGALPRETEICMSVVTQGELLAGVECLPDGRRKIDLRQFYEQIIVSAQEIVPITSAVAERYAIVLAELRRAGRPIVTNDIWIGATALVHGLVLVTNDAHFGYINGLHVEDWTIPHKA